MSIPQTPLIGSVEAFRRTLALLPGRMHRVLVVLFLGIILGAVLETIAAGLVALFASSVSDPTAVLSSKAVMRINELLPGLLPSTSTGIMVFLGVAVVLGILVKNLFLALLGYWKTRFSCDLEGYFGNIIVEGFLRMPYQWVVRQNTADLVLTVQWCQYFGYFLVAPCLTIISDALLVALMLISLLLVQPAMSFTVLLTIGTIGFVLHRLVRKKLDKVSTSLRNKRKRLNRDVTKSIHGNKDIRISGRMKAFTSEYEVEIASIARQSALRQFLTQAPQQILESLGIMLICGATLFLILTSQDSKAVVTGSVAFLAVAAWRILPAVGRLLSSSILIRNGLPQLTNQFEYLDQILDLPEDVGHPSSREAVAFREGVRLADVEFRYQGTDRDTLLGLDLSIAKGATVGLVGVSGAGKTTLVNILIGLLEPTRGAVLVDGKPLTEIGAGRWVRSIGYVPQEPYIYDGTLAENIAFGYKHGEIDRDLVLKCCRMAAIDFLDDLAEGIDTPIGERGVLLSGGQRQRVSIARALYTNPEMIIFDEATSALDSASERSIQKTIYDLKGTLTLVIIAHRLSTVEDCDLVAWLEHGRVRMQGPPGEVLASYRAAGGRDVEAD